MKIHDYTKQYPNMLAAMMLTGSILLLAAGCDEIDGGTVQNSVPLPTDSVLNLYCENEGVYPEDCVLDNPDNPYARVSVTEDNKFALSDEAPSAKSRYYLWATALAKGAGITGENQYYTALSLQEVYGESGSPTTRDQARKAYRSALDNFYYAPTFFGPFTEDDLYFANLIKDLIGENLVAPGNNNLVSLYNSEVEALSDLGVWGYGYDQDNNLLFFFE